MSARHALVFTMLVAVLLPFYYFVDRPQVRIAAPRRERVRLLKIRTIDAVTLTAGSQRIRFEKAPDGHTYKLVEPQGKFIPQDLMQALVSLLINARSVEVVSANDRDLVEFGLDRPRAEIAIQTPTSRTPIEIFFGSDNPPATAIYARIKGIPKVFLLGKNLEYYQTLMFQWVEGKQGKNA